MAETYCGKSCAECAHKEQMNCSGCKTGPGRQYGGDCELAKCVRDKGHETCDTCIFKGNCGSLRSRDHMPDYRRRKIEAEEMRKAAVTKRAPVLAKWIWLLFWLIIPNTIGSLMTNDTITKAMPGLFLPGQILNTVCAAASGFILLKLGTEEEGYRTAGICGLIAAAVNVVVTLVNGPGESAGWTLIFTLPAAVVAMVGQYHKYMSHAAVLAGVDSELPEKWETLWKWNLALTLGIFGCIFLILIIPLLAAIALLGTGIGMIVVGILELVYLYRTAKIFREYPV